MESERLKPAYKKAIVINIAEQTLRLEDQLTGDLLASYSVSTAKRGHGQQEGSMCTPLGNHYVRAKIGSNLPMNAVFQGRRWTGEIYNLSLSHAFPERDWVLSRILWLCGCEIGKNRLGDVDTMRRYIYIHGTPDSEPMGVPLSHGCVRMRNQDIIALFDHVPIYVPVRIELNAD